MEKHEPTGRKHNPQLKRNRLIVKHLMRLEENRQVFFSSSFYFSVWENLRLRTRVFVMGVIGD